MKDTPAPTRAPPAMLPDKYRYIVVEGPIGVGKTSLARRLADRLNADAMLENSAANPFLRGFYRDMRRYAFSTQMFFLFHRVAQIAELEQRELGGRPAVADFLLEKDTLFARLTLSDEEFRLYQQIYRRMAPEYSTPDLVIYLQAPVPTLAERVKRRGNAIERAISEHYLTSLNESYASFFHAYSAAPLLIVNSENLNFVDSAQDFDLLLQRIINLRGGREFFSRG